MRFDQARYLPSSPGRYVLLNQLATRVVDMCKAREWSMHWTHRGAYLHLESSELIEAIRGKHGDPVEEAGDVLLVLMSITEYAGIPFSDVIEAATKKLAHLETAPTYTGEESPKLGKELMNLILTDQERERFASWLEHEATTARGVVEQLKQLGPQMEHLATREKAYSTAALVIARKLRANESDSIGLDAS